MRKEDLRKKERRAAKAAGKDGKATAADTKAAALPDPKPKPKAEL
jgi:hypothetical protein